MKQSTGNEDKINSILRVWKERGGAGILALDGMCGAGKTTLAGLLSEKTGCPVVHMDDYYLPFSRRAENWREIPAGNMDLLRLKSEVIDPFQRHEPIRTMRFQCRTEQYVSECIPPSEGLILEGTYSCHPILRDDYALRVFLEISGKTQRERILVREKENSSNFFQIWIPMEMNYFQSCEVKSHTDLCLHTEWRNER